MTRPRTARSVVSLGSLRALKTCEIGQQIVELGIAQPLGAERRHGRLFVGGDAPHVLTQVTLNALARVHDLNGEEIFVLLDAADLVALSCRQRHRLVAGSEVGHIAPNLTGERGACARHADAREVGPDSSTAIVDAVACEAVRGESVAPLPALPRAGSTSADTASVFK